MENLFPFYLGGLIIEIEGVVMLENVKVVFGWFIGVPAVLLGIAMIFLDPILSIALFVIAILSLPPVTSKLKTRSISIFYRSIISVSAIFVLAFVSGLNTVRTASEATESLAIEQEKYDLAIKQAQDKLEAEYFDNKAGILQSAVDALSANDLAEASAILDKYHFIDDPDLQQHRKILATTKQKADLLEKEAAAAKKESELVELLRAIPSKEYVINRDLYQELVELRPNNEKYVAKMNYYADLQEKKEDRNQKIRKQFLPYSGAHIGVMASIRQSMHDPDSLEHVRTSVADNGDTLTVTTTVRGSNSFGAKVLAQYKAKVSLDGRILSLRRM